jgi:hypothetical protein
MVNSGEGSASGGLRVVRQKNKHASSLIINDENEGPKTVHHSITDIHLHKCLLH